MDVFTDTTNAKNISNNINIAFSKHAPKASLIHNTVILTKYLKVKLYRMCIQSKLN